MNKPTIAFNKLVSNVVVAATLRVPSSLSVMGNGIGNRKMEEVPFPFPLLPLLEEVEEELTLTVTLEDPAVPLVR